MPGMAHDAIITAGKGCLLTLDETSRDENCGDDRLRLPVARLVIMVIKCKGGWSAFLYS